MATIATVAMTSQAQDLMTPEILWSMHRLGARSINAEGTLIAYTTSTPDVKANKSRSVITVMGIDGTGTQQLTQQEAPNQSDPAFFGNAKQGTQRIAYMQQGNVWSMKTDGTDIRQHSQTGDIEGFLISPDAKSIILIRQIPATSSIQPKEQDLPEATGLVINDLNYKHWDQYVQTIPHISSPLSPLTTA